METGIIPSETNRFPSVFSPVLIRLASYFGNMRERTRGRPKGSTGQAAILVPDDVKALLRSARHHGRYVDRAELDETLTVS